MGIEETYIHLSRMVEITVNDNKILLNLFVHPFYYLQNQNTDKDVANYCKALLFLHTLPFKQTTVRTFFNSLTNIGGTELAPIGYLYFIGGLIWRKRYVDQNNIDPIIYVNGNTRVYDQPNTPYDTLLYRYGDTITLGCVKTNSHSNGRYNAISYDSVVYTKLNPLVERKLVEMFQSFANNGFNEIKKSCELYERDETTNTATIRELTYTYLVNLTNEITTLSITSPYTPVYEYLLKKLANFGDNYAAGFTDEQGYLHAYFDETNPIQQIFRELYFGKTLVTTVPIPKNNDGISKNNLLAYYNGYSKVLGQKLKEKEEEKTKAEVDNNSRGTEIDIKCELYMTMKNIWDRWLCGYYGMKKRSNDDIDGRDIFKVNNFFRNNFIFIDSFYNNIYNVLKLNCNKLLRMYVGDGTNQSYLGKTTVAHLGGVASDHMCMMFNFPDNVNFSGLDKNGNPSENEINKYMCDMFKPIPVNMVQNAEYANKFTIIYTHSANKLDTIDRNKFIPDSFDIWSYDQGTEVVPDVFRTKTKGRGANDYEMLAPESRIGYKVPAFGVAYSRQNNSFWKNIDVSMDNFSVTEQAVRAESYIAEKGNSDNKNICFYGQDIYSLYQAYSYLVTVEMMGNAQIQPLMYFQLLNVPMFRGSYMIIRVEHTMTQGNMVTRFTGMKMSKVQVPYTTNWFDVPVDENYSGKLKKNADQSNDKQDMFTADDGTEIDLADNDFSRAIIKNMNNPKTSDAVNCDIFVKNVYDDYSKGKVKIKGILLGEDNANVHNNMYVNIANDDNWLTNKLRITATKSNNWKSIPNDQSKPKVGDLLFGYHNSKSDGNFDHVAIYLGIHNGKRYVAEGISVSGTDIQENNKKIQITSIENSRLGLSTDSIVWMSHCKRIEVEQMVVTNNSLTTSSGAPTEGGIMPGDHGKLITYSTLLNLDNGMWMMEQLINVGIDLGGSERTKLTQLQAAAIVGCFYGESRWNAKAKGPAGDWGIPQWLGSRRSTSYQKFYQERYGKSSPTGYVDELTELKPDQDNSNKPCQWHYILYEFSKNYFTNTCRLWGNNPNGTVRFGEHRNLCGNLMAWRDVTGRNEEALCNMVYRFMVAYENGDAPYHGKAFNYNGRCCYALTAYDLYTSRH